MGCTGSSSRGEGVYLRWEGWSGTYCRSFGPPRNSLFAPTIHNRDDLEHRFSPFKITWPTRAHTSCSCGQHFSSLRPLEEWDYQVHSSGLLTILFLRNFEGSPAGLEEVLILAGLSTDSRRTKTARDSPYHCLTRRRQKNGHSQPTIWRQPLGVAQRRTALGVAH